MEDIKKAIEEASKNYSLQFAEDYREEAKDDFKHGAEWMRNKWEESERWRKVEEELPEDNITVLLEIEYDGIIDYSTGHFYDKGKESYIDCELYEDAIITRWKPIH